MSTEQYARCLLEHDLKSSGGPRRHISEIIRENMRDVPPEVLAQLPTDGASVDRPDDPHGFRARTRRAVHR